MSDLEHWTNEFCPRIRGALGMLAMLALSTAPFTASCGRGAREAAVVSLACPAPPASVVPQATALDNSRLLLSWQTPLPAGGYSFDMAVRSGSQWSEVRRIARGPSLSMFSADLPAVAALPAGRLLAYWELKDRSGQDPYATTIQTAVSDDEGRSWSTPATPYGTALSGQHSFLSWFPLGAGVGLVWLDAQEQAKARFAPTGHHRHESATGSIGLRFSALDSEGKQLGESFVDPITCECCPTSAAVTAHGPVVAYRGRQEAPGTKPSEVQSDRPTVRDIYVARFAGDRWTRPHLVHPDKWVVDACPDNGPSIDARGDRVAVAWWTGSQGSPKVELSFSDDAGDSFGKPVRVDLGKAEGQATVALLQDGRSAVVGWLEQGKTWARVVPFAGTLGPPQALGDSPRHSRLPRWIVQSNGVYAAWSSIDGGIRQVRLSLLKL